MSAHGRNESCPCGSGAKYKRCCGATRESADRLYRRLSAREEILGWPALEPSLRPSGAEFDAWAATKRPDLGADEVRLAVESLDGARRRAILDAAAGQDWDQAVADLGDPIEAEVILLTGAVVAGVRERQPPPPSVLALGERMLRESDDPIALLACLLNPFDLWGVRDLGRLPDIPRRDLLHRGLDALWGEHGDACLARQVERLAAHVSLGRGSVLDEAVTEACAAALRDERERRELAALLLVRATEFMLAAA
jgi:hypothetical protein